MVAVQLIAEQERKHLPTLQVSMISLSKRRCLITVGLYFGCSFIR